MLTDTLTPNSGLNQGFPAQQLSKLLAKTEAELQAYYQSWRTLKKTARPNYDQAFIAGLVRQSKDGLFCLQQAKQRLEAERLEAEHDQQQKKEYKQRKQKELSTKSRTPKNLNAVERMERKLKTKRGKQEYSVRSRTIEPTFGQIKNCQGIDSFYGRYLLSSFGEWNLLKLFRSMMKNGSKLKCT